MNWLFDTLRSNPEIAIFLALALGFLVGGVKLGKFSLGNVTGVLLAGVLIGQLNITISPNVKSVFFLMFLFAVGYSVGPQFFRGLKSDGLPQVFFAVILCVACLLATFIAAKLAGYNIGQAAGLLSGACTISAVLGVASDTMGQIGLSPDQHKAMVDAMPVAYAVTYLFGTAGSAWFLASIGPKLLGVNLAKECADYEAKMGGTGDADDQMSAYRRLTTRAYQVPVGATLVGKTIAEFEAQFTVPRVFIMRLRQASKICEADPKMVIQTGDVLGLAGPRDLLLKIETALGPEVDDRELFDVPIQLLDVVITNKAFAGMTLLEIRHSEAAQAVRGVFLRKLIRAGQEMPLNPGTKVDRGDVVQLVGPVQAVDQAAKEVGLCRPGDRENRCGFHGIGHRDWRAYRRHRHQNRPGAAQPEHQRRGADGGIGLRLSALGEPDLRAHSGTRALGVQQHWPDRLHRRGRDQLRAEFCGGAQGGRHQSVSLGSVCHHRAVCRRHLRR